MKKIKGLKILHVGLCCQPKPYNGFQQAFIDVVGEENYAEISTGLINLNEKAKEIFDSFNPDIVFMQIQAAFIIDISFCKYMTDKGAKVINWTGDKRNETPKWMVELAPYIYSTSFSNMDDVNYMRSLGFKSDYLEIGYDPLIYTPVGEAYDMPEIVFMGNNYGAGHFPMSEFRIKMVEFLQKEYGNRFGVYGVGWNNGNGNYNHSQWEEAKAYRGAKIAINCSHFDSLNYNSDRLLRILGSGCMCLSYEHLGMADTYEDSVCFFKELYQLKDKIDYYLEKEHPRVRLSNTGNEFVKNTFTFKHQVENIIKLAE